jgi:hypothetical protein
MTFSPHWREQPEPKAIQVHKAPLEKAARLEPKVPRATQGKRGPKVLKEVPDRSYS